jgi:FAD/FMN-containing dehydrogenase
LGRAYGDAALPPAASVRPVVITPKADRILSFDQDSGLLTAEAGLALKDLLTVIAPLGWYTPVSPGTQYVTLGGMVASDIHGKNHHVDGCFGTHVRALTLRIGTGEVVTVTPESDPEVFWATCGGMGLTGHILEVTVQLASIPSPWIYETSDRYDSLEEVFHNLREASAKWPMTVAWIDTSARGARLGRGIVMRGRWATPDEAPKHFPKPKGSITMPFTLPNGLMNPQDHRARQPSVFLKTPQASCEARDASVVLFPCLGLGRRMEPCLRLTRLHAIPMRDAVRSICLP